MTEHTRRYIFRLLVTAQDGGIPVAKSRLEVARQFGISEDDVRKIEAEGLEKDWPPL